MPAVRVDILCECEGCAKRFGVEIDLAQEVTAAQGFDELAREEIRSGNGTYHTWGVRGRLTVDRMSLSYQPTIQAGLMLCDVCSEKCDDLPVNRNLTREEVDKVLSRPSSEEMREIEDAWAAEDGDEE